MTRAQQPLKALLLSLIFSLPLSATAQPESASLETIQTQLANTQNTLQEKSASKAQFSDALKELGTEIRDLETDKLNQQIQLKQLDRQIKKTKVMSANPDSPETLAKINKLAYQKEVARIQLDNTEQKIAEKKGEQREMKRRVSLLDETLLELNREIRQLESQKTDQVAAQQASAARKKKEQQLARARAAAAREEATRQKQLRDANAKLLQDQLQQQQNAQAQRAREQEKARLAAKRAAQVRAQEQQATMEDSAFQNRQAELIAANAHLPPAQAALNIAQAWAADPMDGSPKYGNVLTLMVSNPTGSKAKPATGLQHIGNNQYTGRMKVKKGRQEFIIGEHKYTKVIAKHFNNLDCVVVVDARGSRPQFQLLVAPN